MMSSTKCISRRLVVIWGAFVVAASVALSIPSTAYAASPILRAPMADVLDTYCNFKPSSASGSYVSGFLKTYKKLTYTHSYARLSDSFVESYMGYSPKGDYGNISRYRCNYKVW